MDIIEIKDRVNQKIQKKYLKKQVIELAPKKIYLVESGLLKIVYYNNKAQERILNFFPVSSVLAYEFFLNRDNQLNIDEVIACSKCVLVMLDMDEIKKAIGVDSLRGFYAETLQQLYSEQLQISQMLFELEAKQRLMRALYILMKKNIGIVNKDFFIFSMTHNELSMFSGVARESITRVFSNLEKQKLLFKDKRIYSIDLRLFDGL